MRDIHHHSVRKGKVMASEVIYNALVAASFYYYYTLVGAEMVCLCYGRCMRI